MTSKEQAAGASGGDDDAKCPCCNNPWSKGAADMFSQLCAMCEETKTNDDDDNNNDNNDNNEGKEPLIPGLDPANMDLSVKPSDNFYLYSNGGWIRNNPIPAGYPSWNSFLMLHVQSQERLQAMLKDLESRRQTTPGEGTSKASALLTEDEAKVARFYAAAMDEEANGREGIAPLQPLLDLCAATANAAGGGSDGTTNNDTCTATTCTLATSIGRLLSQFGMAAFFAIGASPDNANSDHSLCQVYQGGLGLPDRDYYFDADKEDKRAAYRKHVALMLTLLEDAQATVPTGANVAAAEAIYRLELQLAEAHMTKTENRDPNATYNPMTVSELTERCGGGDGGGGGGGGFDFASYFAAATGGAKSAEELGKINVRNTKAIEKMAEVATSADGEVVHQYLRWHAVNKFAAYLSKPFVDADFNFYEKELAGTAEIKPRWKRAMAFTESALGEVLGKLYCAKYFDESSKSQALQIVETVRQALEDRLEEVDFIQSDATREEALKKMSRFRVKIGYPDKWIDYSSLKIEEEDSFLSMVFKARVFDHMRDVEEMNAPTDREKWFMTPQTINAYYHPSLNEIGKFLRLLAGDFVRDVNFLERCVHTCMFRFLIFCTIQKRNKWSLHLAVCTVVM